MNIISVKFITENKIADYKTETIDKFCLNELVIVDNSQTQEIAQIINIYTDDKFKNEEGEGKLIRTVDAEDKKKLIEIKNKANEYIPKCDEIIMMHDVSMSIVDADLSFDEKKLTLYFASDKRVDFRKLVAHFVRTFKKLIRLQQIGPREQAQKIGGYGKCGEEVCCHRYLHQLENVSIDLAKNQNLAEVASNKINGNCGKLLCCLKYENDVYTAMKKGMPEIGTIIKTKTGKGRVIKQNIIKRSVLVELDNENREKIEVIV